MSKLIIDLEYASPKVLTASIAACQAALGCDIPSSIQLGYPDRVDGCGGETPMTATEVRNRQFVVPATECAAASGTIPDVHDDGITEGARIQQEQDADLAPQFPPVAGLPQFPPVSESPVNAVGGSSITNTPAATVGVLEPEVDAAGVPWDERIHSRSKTRIADGTWRVKKGVDPTYVKQVTNELLTVKSSPVASVSPVVTADGPVLTWPTVMQRIVAKQMSKELDILKLTNWLAEHGVAGGFAMLAIRHDLWQAVIEEFNI